MKVAEKGTDRKAEVHLHAQQRIDPLEEFGEWVDPTDGAICCFVPVEESQTIRIDGRFGGTTMNLQYDAFVDGILRKSNPYHGKAVAVHRAKKLDFNKFLFHTDDDIVDSELTVAPVTPFMDLKEGDSEVIGSIELRIFVLRRFDESHELEGVRTYLDRKDERQDGLDESHTYVKIRPDFIMDFDRDGVALDNFKANREKKKMTTARPGSAPWAIFRFHYRSIASIEDGGFECTFDGTSKSQETHFLKIEEVPMLPVGSKPGKAGEVEETPSRQSSVATSTAPTPSKAANKKVVYKNEGAQSNAYLLSTTSISKQPTMSSTPEPFYQDSMERDRSPATGNDPDLARLLTAFTDTSLPLVMSPPNGSPRTTTESDNQEGHIKTVDLEKVKSSQEKEISRKKPALTITTTTPTKPATDMAPQTAHDQKRTKLSPVLSTSPSPASPTLPLPSTIRNQFAGHQRRIAAARKLKQGYQKQHEQVLNDLTPYHARMLEEMAKEAEVAEEEASEAAMALEADKSKLEKYQAEDN